MDQILIIAGESSAEQYGADLVQEFKKLHPKARFYGIGGKQMKNQGVELLFTIKDLSFIGIFEVFFHIPRVLKMLRLIQAETKKRNPKCAVLIDSPDFNLRIAKKLQKMRVPVLYYISPTVWAWRRKRLKTIKKHVNKMMLIFPFEEKIYQKEQIPAVFVGHPLVQKTQVSLSKQQFFDKHNIPFNKKLITLLPGSRSSEIKQHLPVLVNAAHKIAQKYRPQFLLKLSETIPESEVKRYFPDSLSSVKILKQNGLESLAYSDLVLSACGTANLETALLGTPLISFYRISPLSYFFGKKIVKTKHFSIVNIIADKEVIPELIQKDFNPESLLRQTSRILDSAETRNKMIAEFKKIIKQVGTKNASAHAAAELAKLIHQQSNSI
ncbi:MAG: lipid-A-disaccharide synthase [Candidatus Aminicenantes bacterium]|nr:lipid-A-disaccharide synthase [Candidatus Aminicenantes bacterium]